MKFYTISNSPVDLEVFSNEESTNRYDDETYLIETKLSSYRFVRYFTKTGNKKTIEKNIDLFILQFFENVSNDAVSSDFLFNFDKNKSLSNFNYLLDNILRKSKMGFSVTCEKLARKNKKRTKKAYIFRLKYITGVSRIRHFYKIMSQLVLKDTSRRLYAKLFNTLNSSILDFDNSGINKYKKLLLKCLARKQQF